MIAISYMLLMVALIVFFLTPDRKEYTWWMLSVIGACAGIFLQGILNSFGPIIHTQVVQVILIALEHLLPYSVLMFSLSYSRLLPLRLIKHFRFYFLLPVIFNFTLVYLQFRAAYTALLTLLTGFAYLGSLIILVVDFQRECEPGRRKVRMLTTCLLIESYTVMLLSQHQDALFSSRLHLFPHILPIIVLISIIFWLCHGALWLRTNSEPLGMDSAGAAGVTTSMLNHFIKNRVLTVNLLAEQISRNYSNYPGILNNMTTIQHYNEQVLDIMDQLRNPAHGLQVQLAKTNIIEVVESALTSSLPAAHPHLQIIRNYDSGPLYVLCDEVHMREVILNLLKNAQEAMDKQIHLLTIEITRKRHDVILRFTDNGRGVAADHLAQIFTPYFSLKSNSRRNYGLGLTYCYQVMKRLGGDISVSSKPGTGTTFQLRIRAYPSRLK